MPKLNLCFHIRARLEHQTEWTYHAAFASVRDAEAWLQAHSHEWPRAKCEVQLVYAASVDQLETETEEILNLPDLAWDV